MSTIELKTELETLIADIVMRQTLLAANLTGPRDRAPARLTQVQIKPLLLRGEYKYQFAFHQNRQVTHRNLNPEAAQTELLSLLNGAFKHTLLHTSEGDLLLTRNKRNELAIRRVKGTGDREGVHSVDRGTGIQPSTALPEHPNTRTPEHLNLLLHDRRKNHILEEGQPIPFLVRLGVVSADGTVIAARRDKFRQINRFLEMVRDVVEPLVEQARRNPERPLRIVDFGCGKGYLTFALYHYLHYLCGLKNITLVGVDRKQEVLMQLSALAVELGCEGLSFLIGDINSINLPWSASTGIEREEITEDEPIANPKSKIQNSVDLVVALHACDTATDDALVKAIAWNAQVILAAPCCQHELFDKIDNDILKPMLRHGLIRERLSALITDTLRAELLTLHGYTVQMLEFVDMEHTPKNILLRAVRRTDAPNPARQQAAQETYARFRDFWHVQPYMEQALQQAASNKAGGKEGSPCIVE